MRWVRSTIRIVKKPFQWFIHTRKRNKVFTIIALVIIFFIMLGQIIQATAKPPYEIQKAQKDSLVEVVSETGNVYAGGQVDVFSPATGIIEELYVKNGDDVVLDQPLFKVRSTASEREKAAAYAAYQAAYSAQKTAEQAKLAADAAMWGAQRLRFDAKEAKKEKDNHIVDYHDYQKDAINAADVQAEKDFEAAEKKYKEADIAVTAAASQTNSSWLAYQATLTTVVKAPTKGTIANLLSSESDNIKAETSNISATLTGTSTSPVLAIVNFTSNYSIKLPLNEVDIPKVKIGQPATITLDAFTGKKYAGSVTHVDAVGTNTQGVITYNVMVSIHDADVGIKPGMTADVDIVVDKADGVLSVPNSAVKPYKGGRAVRVIDPKTKQLTFIPVKTGLKGQTKTQILQGISEGQEVVTALSNEQVKRSSGLF